jgi:hypothetical protein
MNGCRITLHLVLARLWYHSSIPTVISGEKVELQQSNPSFLGHGWIESFEQFPRSLHWCNPVKFYGQLSVISSDGSLLYRAITTMNEILLWLNHAQAINTA